MSGYSPDDVPVKTAFGAAQQNSKAMKLSSQLRMLLVMVNGVRTVRELLRIGINGIDVTSFDELYELNLIEGSSRHSPRRSDHPTPSEQLAATAPKKGLSELRFAVIDILLDLSEKDFGARPWVDKIEQVQSIARLSAEVEALCASPFGRKYPDTHNALRRAATP
ncbi:MAG: hypothetical protein JNJ76_12800 [Candidatus Competibacter sp.]|nr:hypothetical protein [Candidatus Competibacter sp.]